MGKLKHLNNEFFKDNIIYNNNQDSEYGIVPIEMTDGMTDLVLKEALQFGEEVNASTNDEKFSDMRNVECWRLNQKESITAELLNHAIIDINKTLNYKLSGLQDVQYLEYHEGGKYDWHSDIGSGVASMRKISISWVLNEGFIGGDLQFFGDNGEIVTYNSTPNKLVSFTSFLNHRVTPVTKGIRKCVVAWVFGESWR
jgi:Rps23 Pro-64 3,4-dihydroxylase Tpa1-like proline 4-hydroxylase